MNRRSVRESLKRMISLIDQVSGDNGCPWVKQQTFKKHFIEFKKEVKELEDAIRNNDKNNLKEELGDVLWDLFTLIWLSEKEYEFKTEEIVDDICDKIIRRKPYLFGNEKAETPEEAVKIWKRIKSEEKRN